MRYLQWRALLVEAIERAESVGLREHGEHQPIALTLARPGEVLNYTLQDCREQLARAELGPCDSPL